MPLGGLHGLSRGSDKPLGAHMGHSEVYLGHLEVCMGHSEVHKGHSKVHKSHSEVHMGSWRFVKATRWFIWANFRFIQAT